jgi:transposase, IS30 family
VPRRPLSISDRVEISTGRKAGWSVRAIAAAIDRAPSVVSREIRRNSGTSSGYRAVTADGRAQRRRSRPQNRKIDTDPVLRHRVLADLGKGRSPRQIAGRLNAEAANQALPVAKGSPDGQGHTVSHETVYTWLYALPKGELARHGVRLDSGRTRRRARRTVGQRTGPIVGMRSIDERPTQAEDRKVPGHWEGDCVIGAANATAAATLVERTTRFTIILALPTGTNADGVAEALIDTITAWPDPFKASLTWDQGTELARHTRITMATGMPVFFAHPHSPWERGTNENTNRIIRRYLPKSTEITSHQPYLDAIAEEINEIPRKVLGWLTPREAYERLLTSTVATTS